MGFNPRNMCRSPTVLRRVATPQSSLRDERKWGRRDPSAEVSVIVAGTTSNRNNGSSVLFAQGAPNQPSSPLLAAPVGGECRESSVSREHTVI